MEKKIKHILFDFDGTIADSRALVFEIIGNLSKKYLGREFSEADLHRLRQLPIRERFKEIGLPVYLMPKMSVDLRELFKQRINTLKTYDGIREILTELKKDGFFLSVISSNSEQNIKTFLDANNLYMFDHIISSNTLFGKHISIKHYLKMFRLNPDEIIYVGDELRDIEACKKIYVKIIAVTWGFDPLPLLKKGNPDYIAIKPENIVTHIESITANLV